MPQRKCWVDGCVSESAKWGLCEMHSSLWALLVRNRPMTKLYNRTDIERYEYYVVKGTSPEIQENFGARADCWLWRGALNHHGYGIMKSAFSGRGNGQQIHLFVLSEIVGLDLDKAQETDHLCRFRPCGNPNHLERVGDAENKLRGIGFGGVNSRKESCDNGHDFTPENTYFTEQGWRGCRECRKERLREYNSRPEVKKAQYDKREPKSGVRGKGQYQAERDTCAENHKLEGDNLIQEKRTRKGKVSYVRRCRICVAAKARDNYAKRQNRQ